MKMKMKMALRQA